MLNHRKQKLSKLFNGKRKVLGMNKFSKYEIFEAAVKATKDKNLTLKDVEVQLKKIRVFDFRERIFKCYQVSSSRLFQIGKS
ncbi:hypothetical protein GTK63_10110 [Lactobacillus crispatus]|uniref:Uncharacterized protein n=2 Tax=Lactobacillus crispatus TaxID=47770 RepID=A0A7X4HPM1_9LACO|nr:hypothetical protein [Lactobacillus crispatus]